MSIFTGGSYGRLAVMINTLSHLNKEIIIIFFIINIMLIVTHTYLEKLSVLS